MQENMFNEGYLDQLKKMFVVWGQSLEGKNHPFRHFLVETSSFFELLCQLAYDPLVGDENKAKLAKAIAYFILPFDLIPEAIIGPAGYLDDLVVSVLALKQILGTEGEQIIKNNWNRKDIDIIKVINEIANDAENMVGVEIYHKLCEKIK
ncbi:MAG: YkvA family protein [Candidatus Omnitrophica bacterium]|nr:YkvA family protein [Candidatus Omnitrophota bacterium]